MRKYTFILILLILLISCKTKCMLCVDDKINLEIYNEVLEKKEDLCQIHAYEVYGFMLGYKSATQDVKQIFEN